MNLAEDVRRDRFGPLGGLATETDMARFLSQSACIGSVTQPPIRRKWTTY